MNKKKYAFLCPIIFGVIFIIIGFCIQVPGGALTTYSSLDGHKVDGSHYNFSDKYSTIDEYVGGDAYKALKLVHRLWQEEQQVQTVFKKYIYIWWIIVYLLWHYIIYVPESR